MSKSAFSQKVAPHAEWLKPFLDLEENKIYLTHRTTADRIDSIKENGLKLPYTEEQKNWGSDMKAIFVYVPHKMSLDPPDNMDKIIRFKYPISKVNVRPPLLSHDPEKYGIKREGIPLDDYLANEPPEVWNLVTCVEFLILEDVPPEALSFE